MSPKFKVGEMVRIVPNHPNSECANSVAEIISFSADYKLVRVRLSWETKYQGRGIYSEDLRHLTKLEKVL